MHVGFGNEAAQFRFVNICFQFSVQCLCSVRTFREGTLFLFGVVNILVHVVSYPVSLSRAYYTTRTKSHYSPNFAQYIKL
jgi:hypothetical protein